jgi:hypothetical protein
MFALEYVNTHRKSLLMLIARFAGTREVGFAGSSETKFGSVVSSSDGMTLQSSRGDGDHVSVEDTATKDATANDDDDDEELQLPAVSAAESSVMKNISSSSGSNDAVTNPVSGVYDWCDGFQTLENIVRACEEAQPNAGELWCSSLKRKGGRKEGLPGALRYGAEIVLGIRIGDGNHAGSTV